MWLSDDQILVGCVGVVPWLKFPYWLLSKDLLLFFSFIEWGEIELHKVMLQFFLLVSIIKDAAVFV